MSVLVPRSVYRHRHHTKTHPQSCAFAEPLHPGFMRLVSLGFASRNVFSLALIFSVACGARSGFETPDAAVDAGPDAPDTGPTQFDVECSDSQMVRPGGSASFSAQVTDDEATPSFSYTWRSDTGAVSFAPDNAQNTIATSMTEGLHRLSALVTDSAGLTGECSTNFAVVNGPPIAACSDAEGLAGTPFWVTTEAFDDDGIASRNWTVLDPGIEITNREEGRVEVLGRTTGTYRIRFDVVDTDGETASCESSVRIMAPPVLECPTRIEVPTRQRTRITVNGTDDGRIVRHNWSVIEPDTGWELDPDGNSAFITVSRQGEYQVRYVATDDDGLSSECTFVVVGLPTPPTIMCPGSVVAEPLMESILSVSAEDDGDVLNYAWRTLSRPEGSAAGNPAPIGNGQTASFTPDLAGIYRVQVTVTDGDGMTDMCVIEVQAISQQGLRMELSWDTDGTDMDSHLLRPDATRYNSDDDCYYANCTGGRLEWGEPGPDDNPRLDIDDTNGFGPENINIDEPYDGVYRVAVHAYGGEAGRIVARIFCGGSDTEPVRVFTGALRSRQVWEVADVEIVGPRCTVRELGRVTDDFPTP